MHHHRTEYYRNLYVTFTVQHQRLSGFVRGTWSDGSWMAQAPPRASWQLLRNLMFHAQFLQLLNTSPMSDNTMPFLTFSFRLAMWHQALQKPPPVSHEGRVSQCQELILSLSYRCLPLLPHACYLKMLPAIVNTQGHPSARCVSRVT